MSALASRKIKWDARRSEISKAAATLIRQKGFNGSSMERLAQSLHIRKATLYHYFSSKQELLYQTLLEAVGSALARVQKIVDSDLSSQKKLRLFVIDHIESIILNIEPVTVFLEEGRFLQKRYREKYVSMRDRYERLLRRILDEGVAKGEFRKMDSKVLGFAILGMCNWIIRWYKPNGSLRAQALARQYMKLIEKGLLKGTSK
ncbi:MAG: TetR/AcrR family transcriptional regulator [Deltaproteobacteria bacterium]|nr:TetR/AcrR family transcriptional regulator [Deltaproteobacteria bacterium]